MTSRGITSTVRKVSAPKFPDAFRYKRSKKLNQNGYPTLHYFLKLYKNGLVKAKESYDIDIHIEDNETGHMFDNYKDIVNNIEYRYSIEFFRKIPNIDEKPIFEGEITEENIYTSTIEAGFYFNINDKSEEFYSYIWYISNNDAIIRNSRQYGMNKETKDILMKGYLNLLTNKGSLSFEKKYPIVKYKKRTHDNLIELYKLAEQGKLMKPPLLGYFS